MSSVFVENLLAGRHAFVAGGTSGINLGIARRLVQAGARASLFGRNPERGLRAAVARFGPVDILVNGAAGNFPAPALGMSSNGFRAVVDFDLVGTFNGCRAGFEHLRQPGGVVVNVSAPQAYAPAVFQSHVCAAKARVDMLTRVLALEWG